jgi:hypothetical protein
MPALNLLPEQLQDAAEAARLASAQTEKEAEKQSNLAVRGILENAARRFRELADIFERARSNPG